MHTSPNICRLLSQEWAVLSASRRGRSAVRRWADTKPAVAGLGFLEEVVAACHRRDRPEDSGRLLQALQALLRLAADNDLAARTVLQAVLPSLSQLATRHAPAARTAGGRWDDVAHLQHDVVAVAYEVITELAGQSPDWPALTIYGRTQSEAPLEAPVVVLVDQLVGERAGDASTQVLEVDAGSSTPAWSSATGGWWASVASTAVEYPVSVATTPRPPSDRTYPWRLKAAPYCPQRSLRCACRRCWRRRAPTRRRSPQVSRYDS